MGDRGRIYFPAPSAQPVNIVVRKRGDMAFLKPRAIEQMLGARVYSFDLGFVPFRQADISPHLSSPLEASSPDASTLVALRPAAHQALRKTRSKWVQFSPVLLDGQGNEAPAQLDPSWYAFLVAHSDEIGIPLQRLLDAIEAWSAEVSTNYQRGLLALYRGNYKAASQHFRDALKDENVHSPTSVVPEKKAGQLSSYYEESLYMSLAYSEYRQGKYSE